MIFAFLILAVMITGCTTPVILQQRVVEAEKIVLKDATGKVRLQIAVDEGGGIVQTFLDTKGTERLKLMVDAENVVRQRFLDEKGTIRMGNSVFPTDSPKVPGGMAVTGWSNKEGQPMIYMQVDQEGVARHTMFDEKGNARMASYVKPVDHPQQAGSSGTEWFSNINGGTWTRIQTTLSGNATHEFIDNNNKRRISLSISNDGVADERFSDAAGEIRAQTYTKGKDASFNLFDTRNKLRFNTTSFQNGTVVQSFLSDTGENKASTTVASDGTVTHYLEKGALEKIWDNRNLILMGVEMWRRFNSDK